MEDVLTSNRSIAAMQPSVLVITDKYAPHPGGTAIQWSRWCSFWPPDQVTIVAPVSPGSQDYDKRQPHRIVRVSYPDIPKIRMPILWLRIYFYGFWQILRRRPDVVHVAQIVPFGPFGALARKIFGIPYVLHFYGEEINAYLKSSFALRTIQWMVARASGVTANSQYTAGLLRKAGVTQDIAVTPPGPSFAVTSTRSRLHGKYRDCSRGPVLITVARLTERKGHDRVLAILPGLLKVYPTLVYLIAGIGPDEARLRRLVRDLRIEPHVTFLGKLADEDLVELYQSADIFVHPNRELASGDVEGFGIVLLEAGSCGLPVIAGRSGGAIEAVKDGITGFLVKDSLEELSSSVLKLLSDKDLRIEMGSQGQRWAATFQWKSVSDTVWSLTRKVALARGANGLKTPTDSEHSCRQAALRAEPPLTESVDCTLCGSSKYREVFSTHEWGLQRCLNCTQLFVSPRPLQSETDDIYNQSYFDGSGRFGNREEEGGYLRNASGYAARARFLVQWIVSLAGLEPDSRWLDVGCGPGYLVQAVSSAGMVANGLELSRAAVAYGRDVLGLEIYQGAAEDLSHLVESDYDIITLVDTLFHLRDPRSVLAQIHSRLTKGGFIFAGPFDLNPPDWIPKESPDFDPEPLGIPEHLTFVNNHSMEIALKALGFTSIQFLSMPEAPSNVGRKFLPSPVLQAIRLIVRKSTLLQRAAHSVAAQVKNHRAGYVLARKP